MREELASFIEMFNAIAVSEEKVHISTLNFMALQNSPFWLVD